MVLWYHPQMMNEAWSMNIDKTNLAIIKHLRNGRKSYHKIARDLAVSENTVRARVQKLFEEGVLDINGVINPESIDGHRVVIVGVKLQSMDLVKNLANLKAWFRSAW